MAMTLHPWITRAASGRRWRTRVRVHSIGRKNLDVGRKRPRP